MSQEQDDKLLEATQMGRRTMLKRVLIGSAVVYTAPMVATFTLDGAAAQPSSPDPFGIEGWASNHSWDWGDKEQWNWASNHSWDWDDKEPFNWGSNHSWDWDNNEHFNWGSNHSLDWGGREHGNWGSNHSWNWGSNETWFWSPNQTLLPGRGDGFLGRLLRLIQRR